MREKKESTFFSWLSQGKADQNNPLLSLRASKLLKSHHSVGNFFHYRHAISILGWKYEDVFKDGQLYLNPDSWADFGPLNFHIGPPGKVIKQLKRFIKKDDLQYYSPDLISSLRDLAAIRLFKQKRSSKFEVIGTEGAQASMAYTIATYVNPGDEVIITDPGYFFLEPPILLAGGKVKRLNILENSEYKMNASLLKSQISKKTKMIIICDPINPFGIVQTKKELTEIIDLAKKHNIIILNNITHSFHSLASKQKHYPMNILSNSRTSNIITVCGVSHSYGLAGLRIGFIGARQELLEPILLTKSALTRININLVAQHAVFYALSDSQFLKQCDVTLLRNFKFLEKIIDSNPKLSFMIKPTHGYFAAIDTSKIKASSQELTIALLKRKCALYPSDGLGNNKAASYLRLNFSSPDIKHFKWLEKALPQAITEAESGIYRKAVISHFKRVQTKRAERIIKTIEGFK